MNNKFKGNIFALTIHLMFSKRITGPVMMLFYQYFGLNFTQIGILSAIYWLTDAFLEVIGGAFSDVYGRKKASMIYATLGMLTMTIFIFGNNFWHFALANLVYGLSLAIGGGNVSSLLFDTLKILKLEHLFKKYRGQIVFPQKIFNGITLLLLPMLFLQNIRFPFAISFLFSFIAFLTATLFFKEPPKIKSECHEKVSQAIRSSFAEILSNNRLIVSIALNAVFGGFTLLLFEYFQPIIKLSGTPLATFGIIYAISRIFEALGGLAVHKFEHHSNIKLLIANAILILFTLLGFGFAKSHVLLFFIMMTALLDGATGVLANSVIHKEVSSKNRTTIASFATTSSALLIAISLAFFGSIGDHIGVQKMFVWAGIIFVILGTTIFLVANHSNKKQKQIKFELRPARRSNV